MVKETITKGIISVSSNKIITQLNKIIINKCYIKFTTIKYIFYNEWFKIFEAKNNDIL